MTTAKARARAKVSMREYLKLCDERDKWQKRALEAEARVNNDGNILGEGRFYCPRVRKAPGLLEE